MVVDVDARHEPAPDNKRRRRQRLELVALDRLEQRPSAALARRRKRAVVPFLDLLGEGGIGLGEREELPVAQRRQHPHLDQSDRIFRGRFVPRLSDPCRDNCHVVMAAERVIAAVQHRVPVVGVGHPGLGVVGDQLLRAAADIGEGADMGAEPVLMTLGPARLSVGQVRAGQASDEDLRLADDALIDDAQRHAGPIDFERLAGAMRPAHRRRPRASLPDMEMRAELGVAVAFRM